MKQPYFLKELTIIGEEYGVCNEAVDLIIDLRFRLQEMIDLVETTHPNCNNLEIKIILNKAKVALRL
jgi:hypothetical protein